MEGEYTTVVSGFDVSLTPSPEEGDNFDVILAEGGNEVYRTVIPIPVDENSDLAYAEDLISYAAQAAVDLYEAERGTLGQGAGATMQTARKARTMKKKAYLVSTDWEDWYLKLKGTPYGEQALTLLDQLIELRHRDTEANEELDKAYEEERKIYQELDRLNLDRLKTVDPHQTIIVVGRRNAIYSAQDIQDFLDKFKGHVLEPQAVSKVQELLDVRTKITNLDNSWDDIWEEQQDLEAAMNELLLQQIQQDAIQAAPDTGMESAPAMANDLAELMEDVSLDEPLEPMIAKKAQEFDAYSEVGSIISRLQALWPTATKLSPDDELFEKYNEMLYESKKVLKRMERTAPGEPLIDTLGLTDADIEEWNLEIDEIQDEMLRRVGKKALHEVEEDHLIEVGEVHEGLDPAEVEPPQNAWNTNEYAELKHDVEVTLWGGIRKSYPQGTKGYVESLFDKFGDYYLFRTETGHLVKVKWDDLKSAPKGKKSMKEAQVVWDEDSVAEDMAKELDVDFDDLIVTEEGTGFRVEEGAQEYIVFPSYDEAERYAVERVRDDLEMEPELFNQDWLQHFLSISETDRRLIANDMVDSYVDDIEDERVLEEAGYDPDEPEVDAETAREELRERMWEDVYDRLEDPIQYFVEDEGIYSIEDLFKANFTRIDLDRAAQEAVDVDGVAHFLAGYDGEERETPSGLFYYRWN